MLLVSQISVAGDGGCMTVPRARSGSIAVLQVDPRVAINLWHSHCVRNASTFDQAGVALGHGGGCTPQNRIGEPGRVISDANFLRAGSFIG